MSLYGMSALLILVVTPFLRGVATNKKTGDLECSINKDCSSETLCVEGKCINPCLLNLCDDPKSCRVTNHIPVCFCVGGFSGVLVNWYQAVASCNAMNMDLVTLDNQREYDTLVHMIRQSNLGPVDFWLAGTDLTEKGNYLWISTGKPMAYFNFVPGEPNHWTNNGEMERCIEITEGVDYKMNDDICSERNFHACEYYE